MGEEKGKRKRDRGGEVTSPALPLDDSIYLPSIQDNYLRHRLSTLARLLVGLGCTQVRVRMLLLFSLAPPLSYLQRALERRMGVFRA